MWLWSSASASPKAFSFAASSAMVTHSHAHTLLFAWATVTLGNCWLFSSSASFQAPAVYFPLLIFTLVSASAGGLFFAFLSALFFLRMAAPRCAEWGSCCGGHRALNPLSLG
jgi:hypothetical protein